MMLSHKNIQNGVLSAFPKWLNSSASHFVGEGFLQQTSCPDKLSLGKTPRRRAQQGPLYVLLSVNERVFK